MTTTETPQEAYDEDWFEEVISDTIDMDWQPRWAARAIMRKLAEDNAAVVQMPKRGTDCPTSYDGFHHVDTSMESGPNNCFHCDVRMKP